MREHLGPEAHRLVHDTDGANLKHGIAAALCPQPRSDIAILETDERVAADLVRLRRPEVSLVAIDGDRRNAAVLVKRLEWRG